ncbi:cellulose synthase family protein [Flavobacterium sp. RSP49]|uniref:cellulose synthase family protein n=1 Tax=Flavobacterium sp. RSP49 TaxID=2497487 RepID=UPI0018FEF951|nr:cellulose synthase family protein [Flavobacterium sp. RSP49]
MLLLSYLILFVFSFAIVIIFVYGLAQLNLLINYLKSKKQIDHSEKFDFTNPSEIPFVTIQLPLFNEKYVVERLLRTIAKLEYPKEKLEIQVLDDSDDDSILITKQVVAELSQNGLNIKYLCRTNRTGFKAGALKEGLISAKGAFVAIFDADFVPQKDWLLQTIPYFKDQRIGVVQTRWGHLNRDYSVLTKIQAFALDAHFTLEQVGRSSQTHFINFNGTAGVWRKECILDAGNWESDTLTEDLDLSYRAQLKKWKFKYLEHIVTPAELPAIISAARSQQFRWNKGGAENLRKMFFRIITAKTMTTKNKIHGILHLMNSSLFLAIFVMALLSVPVLYIKSNYAALQTFFDAMLFFIITTIIFFFYYWIAFKNTQGNNFFKFTQSFLTFYVIALGFSFNNTIAVLEGLWGKKSEFIRTPKLNIEEQKDHWQKNTYISKKISKKVLAEGILSAYFLFGIYSSFTLNDYSLLLLHLMLFCGFGFVFLKSIADTK